MKQILFSFLLLTGVINTSCSKTINQPGSIQTASPDLLKARDPLQDSIQAIINKYVNLGIPGIQVAIKRDASFSILNGGYASIETQTPMDPQETDMIFSITKTYTASLLMKQVEAGTIKLDNNIGHYLPNTIADSIVGADIITVRMLLNHTSGIVNFTGLPRFIGGQFTHPLNQLSPEQKLELVYGKQPNFKPGTDFSYSNTNYLLLHMILENTTGKSYADLLQDQIIQPLQLSHTHYDLSKQQLLRLNFPNYYIDADASGEVENASEWNLVLGNTCLAYGGIAAKAADVIKFYEALVNGKVVSNKSLKAMTTWTQGKTSTQPDYGLGIEYYQFAPGTTAQFGHEGDGIGCTTQIMYIPDTHTYLYINCTVGRQVEGPFLYKTTDFKNELCAFVAKWRP